MYEAINKRVVPQRYQIKPDISNSDLSKGLVLTKLSVISGFRLTSAANSGELAHAAASWLIPAFLEYLVEVSHQQSPDVGGLMVGMTLWKRASCHPGSFPSAAYGV